MFNIKQSQLATEKYLRDDPLGPVANDDKLQITEKKVPHRTGVIEETTEKQMDEKRESEKEAQIIEKLLNEAKGSYIEHRSDAADLPVPPQAALLEKMRKERMEDYKTDKSSHWTQTFNERRQQGALPKFPKNAPQSTRLNLNNDPKRFKNDSVEPLVGHVTTADMDRVATNIKTGRSLEFDTAMVAILREADKERRELTPIEQKIISELKQKRTQAMLKI